jgi:UDP-N-acetylglucosamine 2-epimerase (non-hydrolysing)
MLDQVLRVWNIAPEHDLRVMRPGQTLAHVTSAVIDRLHRVLEEVKPDTVLVQGDTTTAMAATLAAFYQRIPVGHIEAGLRTHDLYDPFPEEANRQIIGLLASMHFAPTAAAAQNLVTEGRPPDRVVVTGNTVIDAFLQTVAMPLDLARTPLATLCPEEGPPDRRIILVTCHRRENFGGGLADICGAVRELAEERPELLFVIPVHPNPQVHDVVSQALGRVANVALTPPLEYQPLVWLMQRCSFLLTDSGGLQEEATAVGRPVLVLRDTTERPEGVEAGTAVLVGSDPARILMHARRLLDNPAVYHRMSRRTFPYGNGTAAVRIADSLTAAEHVMNRASMQGNGHAQRIGLASIR